MASATTPREASDASKDKQIYKTTFYVPPSHTQACLSALFASGAGIWPNSPSSTNQPGSDTEPPKYTNCAFISRGTGTFLPSDHATPHIGAPNQREEVEEDRVEVILVADGSEMVRRAVAELRRAHPYEVAAVFVVRCEDF